MKKPSNENQKKCMKLRCDSKRGSRLHPEDLAFCEKMFNEFPEWYAFIEDEIWEKTKPFGA